MGHGRRRRRHPRELVLEENTDPGGLGHTRTSTINDRATIEVDFLVAAHIDTATGSRPGVDGQWRRLVSSRKNRERRSPARARRGRNRL